MALTDENSGGMVMPVTPMGGYGNNGGFGFGGDWAWILLLLVLGGGWGGFGMGGYGGMMMGMDGGWGLYPWLNNSEHISDGFRDQQLNTQISSIQNGITSGFGDVQNALCSGFGNVQTALCGGFAGTTAAVTNAQNALSQQLNTNQIADLERSFAAQTASTQGMNGIQAQLAQCCCDNRSAVADLKYTVANEACADRAAVNDALRDVLTANTASTQRILDQMCQDKIDAKNERITELQNQLAMAQLAASQNAQTAAIQSGQRALANEIEQYTAPTPRPAYIVSNPNGCGCGNMNNGCGSCSGF